MDTNEKECWRKFVALHIYVKNRVILAEEFDSELNTFAPPLIEQRSALDHVARAQGAQLGILLKFPTEEEMREYTAKQLDKALGHLYRAYFDVADWLAMSIREKVVAALEPYSADCIKASLPDYYPTFRPQLTEIPVEIAMIRAQKDIGGKDLLAEVNRYEKQLDALIDIYRTIIKAGTSL